MATTLTAPSFPATRGEGSVVRLPSRSAVPVQRAAAAPGPTAPAPRGRGTLRLTRRGRLVVLAVLAVVLCVAFSLGRVSSSASTGAPDPVHRTVVVQAGDTLWQVAGRVAPGRDTRVVVAQLAQLNHLGDDPVVQAGQQLLVP